MGVFCENFQSLAKFPLLHDDIIKWKHFSRYWPFERGIYRSPVNSPHKDQWRGALMFSLNCAGINGWVNNREAGDLRRHHAHYDVTIMVMFFQIAESMHIESRYRGTELKLSMANTPKALLNKMQSFVTSVHTETPSYFISRYGIAVDSYSKSGW